MNWHDSGRFCTDSLESAAKRYKTLGFSIIPLQGARNPQQAKLPAIRWARYQHSIASDEELHDWFRNEAQAGIGIVCGRISRLMVLDFDDASEASEFRHLFPDLVQTLVVRSGTRGLPHFYYRLPAGKIVPTSAYECVDVRGEGSYVVAPPTQVGKVRWSIERDGPIREVSEFDLRRITGFLTSRKAADVASLSDVRSVAVRSEASEFRRSMTAEELVQYYQERCCKGRNQALFQTAIIARDTGIAETAFVVMLAGVHASEPGTIYEPYRTRYAEAVRTIASAYSRPASQSKAVTYGLSNAVREWLLGHDLACVARVVDGLFVSGMKSGSLFTEAEACERLAKLKIGRRSIMAALKCVINDFDVFAGGDSPHYPPIGANAAKVAKTLTHSCEMSRGAKRVKNGRRGRPARMYRLPSTDEIAAKLGVSNHKGDALSENDFGSAKAYREALHEKLLERRPGHYARAWLATRLGVSRWTARRYEKARGVVVRPAYAEDKLTWSTARNLPDTKLGLARGVFIETREGKRYPAVKGLALRLLKSGQQVILHRQLGNYYAAQAVSVGIPTPRNKEATPYVHMQRHGMRKITSPEQTLSVGIPTPETEYDEKTIHGGHASQPTNVVEPNAGQRDISVGIPTLQKAEPSFWLCPDCLNFHVMEKQPERCMRCGNTTQWEILSPTIWRDADALRTWWQKRYREHQYSQRPKAAIFATHKQAVVSRDNQLLADRLHTQVSNLSLKNARHLVRQFSDHLIEKALTVINGRSELRNPAGFLISFLRSECRLSNGRKINSPAKPTGESAMDWLRRLAKSEYLSFVSNVDDILSTNMEPNLLTMKT